MSKYEELKYVLSGATDCGYEYVKKEDVEAAFAELEERHAMELDQWVLELGKMKAENERLKKLLFNAQKAASDAKLSAHEKSRRIDELNAENESLKYSVATLDTDIAMMKRWRKVSEELPNDGEPGNVDTVLVAVEIRTIDGVQYRLETAFYMDGKFWMTQKKRSTFDKEDFGGYGYLIQKVTHWMPMPNAPKEA